MRIQIQLNENNPKEKALADKVRSFGTRSGVPKQIFIEALTSVENIATPRPRKNKSGASIKSAAITPNQEPKSGKLKMGSVISSGGG